MSTPARFARGRLPENKLAAKLPLGEFLRALPAYPLTDVPPGLMYPMDHNDHVSCCVVAAVDHALRVINTQLTGSYVQPPDDELLAWYQTQNPRFTSWDMGGSDADGGMIVAQFLSWLVREGVILGFARIDHTNEAEIRAAVYLGLAIITGEDVRKAQMESLTWDYTPNSPDDGGHATATHGYQPGSLGVITWGSDSYVMTDAYLHLAVDEAYMIITQAHIDHPGFRQSFDLPAFAAAYHDITGRPFPVDVPPVSPQPAPPVGGRTLTLASDADVAALRSFAEREHHYHVLVNAREAIQRGTWDASP